MLLCVENSPTLLGFVKEFFWIITMLNFWRGRGLDRTDDELVSWWSVKQKQNSLIVAVILERWGYSDGGQVPVTNTSVISAWGTGSWLLSWILIVTVLVNGRHCHLCVTDPQINKFMQIIFPLLPLQSKNQILEATYEYLEDLQEKCQRYHNMDTQSIHREFSFFDSLLGNIVILVNDIQRFNISLSKEL